jgi:hypothetical protein
VFFRSLVIFISIFSLAKSELHRQVLQPSQLNGIILKVVARGAIQTSIQRPPLSQDTVIVLTDHVRLREAISKLYSL